MNPTTNHLLIQELNFDEMINKAQTPEEKEYQEHLNSILYEVQELANQWLKNDENKEKYYYMSEQQYDFFAGLEGEWDDIISNSHGKVKKLLKTVYEQGTKYNPLNDFDPNNVYTNAHKNAFQFALDYNFGLIQNLTDDFRGAIKNRIIQSAVEGKNPYKTADDLVKMGLEPLPGSTLSPKQRATMIAKTETSRVQNTGMLQEYINQGFKHVLILTAEDKDVCPICLKIAYQYKKDDPVTFETRGKERRLDIVSNAKAGNLPPFHPNCRCTVMTVWATKGDPPEDPYIIDLTPKGKGGTSQPKPAPKPKPKPKPSPKKDMTLKRLNNFLGREVETKSVFEPKFIVGSPDESTLFQNNIDVSEYWDDLTGTYLIPKFDSHLIYDEINHILTFEGMPVRYSLNNDAYYFTKADKKNYNEVLDITGERLTSFRPADARAIKLEQYSQILSQFYVEEIGDYVFPQDVLEIDVTTHEVFLEYFDDDLNSIRFPVVDITGYGDWVFEKDYLAPPPEEWFEIHPEHLQLNIPLVKKEIGLPPGATLVDNLPEGYKSGYYYIDGALPYCNNREGKDVPCKGKNGFVQYITPNEPHFKDGLQFHPTILRGNLVWYVTPEEIALQNAKWVDKASLPPLSLTDVVGGAIAGEKVKVPAVYVTYDKSKNKYTFKGLDVKYNVVKHTFELEVAPDMTSIQKEVKIPKKYKFKEDEGIYEIPRKDLVLIDGHWSYQGVPIEDFDDNGEMGLLNIRDVRKHNLGIRWKDAGWLPVDYVPDKYRKYPDSHTPIYLIPLEELTVKVWDKEGFSFEAGKEYYFYKDMPFAKVENARISDGKVEAMAIPGNYNDTITPPIIDNKELTLPKSYRAPPGSTVSYGSEGYFIPKEEMWYSFRNGEQRWYYEGMEIDYYLPDKKIGYVSDATLAEYNSQFKKTKRKLKVPLDDNGEELIPSRYLEGKSAKDYKYFIPETEEGNLEGLHFIMGGRDAVSNYKYRASFKHVPLSYDDTRGGYWISLKDARKYDRSYVKQIIEERNKYRKTHKYEDIRTPEEMAKWYGFEYEKRSRGRGDIFRDRIFQSEIVVTKEFMDETRLDIDYKNKSTYQGIGTSEIYKFSYKDVLGMYYDMPDIYKAGVNRMTFDYDSTCPDTGGWYEPWSKDIVINANPFQSRRTKSRFYWNGRFTLVHESSHALDYVIGWLPAGDVNFFKRGVVFDNNHDLYIKNGRGLASVSKRIEEAMYKDAKHNKWHNPKGSSNYGSYNALENWAECGAIVGINAYLEKLVNKVDDITEAPADVQKVVISLGQEMYSRDVRGVTGQFSQKDFLRRYPNLYKTMKDIILNTPWWMLDKEWKSGGYVDGVSVRRK